jgi:hypothetical protein
MREQQCRMRRFVACHVSWSRENRLGHFYDDC